MIMCYLFFHIHLEQLTRLEEIDESKELELFTINKGYTEIFTIFSKYLPCTSSAHFIFPTLQRTYPVS
jgi:hypothetical protein